MPITFNTIQPIVVFIKEIPSRCSRVGQVAREALLNFKAYCFSFNVKGLANSARVGNVNEITQLIQNAESRRQKGLRGISQADFNEAWIEAVKKGHIEALKVLKGFNSTQPSWFGSYSVGSGHVDYWKSAEAAALNGHLNLLRYFLGQLTDGISRESIEVLRSQLIDQQLEGPCGILDSRETKADNLFHYPHYTGKFHNLLDSDSKSSTSDF